MNAPERAAVSPVARQRSACPPGPRHVAIIMDGNGRWATSRGLPRVAGHGRGVETVRKIVRHVRGTGLEVLTLFSFSSENWLRPAEEVNHLLTLVKSFIQTDLAELHEAGVRVRVLGRRDDLSNDLQALIAESEQLTANNRAVTLQVAFNYGARDEIVRAAQRLVRLARQGALDAAEITEQTVNLALDTQGLPDPDLIIRTSGEQRLSNFLLWQAAYAEFIFVPEYWPDFDGSVYDRVMAEYHGRDRRFGGL